MAKRQNILLILTDEESYPRPDEDDKIRQFRNTELPGHKFFEDNGVEFMNHMIASSACRPSRASLFTGQHPSTTRVFNTNGFAKGDNDNKLNFDIYPEADEWLPKKYLPTMGTYFRSLGYKTFYVGKWHITNIDEDHTNHTIDHYGNTIQSNYEYYKNKDFLDDYGFSGWVGAEPHGTSSKTSGVYMDPFYTDQALEIMNMMNDKNNPDYGKPFLLVVCYVNPHDIVLINRRIVQSILNVFYTSTDSAIFKQTLIPNMDHIPDLDIKSKNDNLRTKPSVQKKYLDKYPELLMSHPPYNILRKLCKRVQRKYYYYLISRVSKHINRLIEHLKLMSYYNDTFSALTSDHGDLLGSHGDPRNNEGLQQKWHCAYKEVINVPFFVHHPLIQPRKIDFLTSHVDIIPTLLGLALINQTNTERLISDDLIRSVKNNFMCQNELKGRDLSASICNEQSEINDQFEINDAVYFNTEDQISKGESQYSILSRLRPFTKSIFKYSYKSIEGADCVEAVMMNVTLNRRFLKEYFTRHKRLIKKFYPEANDIVDCVESVKSMVKLVRYYDLSKKEKDEWEMYVDELDKYELINVSHNLMFMTNSEYELFMLMFSKLIEASENTIHVPSFKLRSLL